MSDSSPRWPGADGSPGLDFSGRGSGARQHSSPAAPASQSSAAAGVVEQDQAHRASPPDAQATPNRAASAESPAHAESGPAVPPPNDAVANRAPDQDGESPQTKREEDSKTHLIPPVTSPTEDPRSEASAKAFSTQSTAPWQSRMANDAIEVPVSAPTNTPVAAASAAGAGVATGAAAASQRSAPRKDKNYARGARRTRKARLRLARIDPWSVMKTSFLFSIAFGIMMVVIASVLWSVLAGSGALESMDSFLAVLLGDGENNPFQLEAYLNTSRVLGFATLIAAIDVVIITAVATLFAFLYNLAATIIGGLEVTLAED